MDTSVDDVFHIHTSKVVTHCGQTKDRMHAVSGCKINKVSRSEWEHMFEKEGNVKKKSAFK